VNGSEMDDVNEWVNVNHAGVLWLDNVVLLEVDSTAEEIRARGGKTYPVDTRVPELAVESIDLGERLYGKNVVTVTLMNRGRKVASGKVSLRQSGIYREDDPKKAGYVRGAVGQEKLEPDPRTVFGSVVTADYRVTPGDRARVELPCYLWDLLPDWRSEHRITIGHEDAACEIPLGTWSQQALVEVQKCYPFAEDRLQTVFMNLGVA